VNITLSGDDDVIQKARRHADQLGTSVNQLVRDCLEQLAVTEVNPFSELTKPGQGVKKYRVR
jgi:hypothetical protein